MKAEIISIGTELVLGKTIDTNASYIAKKLMLLGLELLRKTVVKDEPSELISALKSAISRADVIITTGGLGPTEDDITMNSLCSAISGDVVYNKEIEKAIRVYYKNKDLKHIPKIAFRQAYIPKGAKWFGNRVGTAPGILAKYKGRFIICLPGPPRELIPMFEKYVMPYLKKIAPMKRPVIKTKTVKITGLTEIEVYQKTKELFSHGTNVCLGIYPHLGEVHIEITARSRKEKEAYKNMTAMEKEIKQRLRKYIYGFDDETLESVVGMLLSEMGLRISVAESCTGGLISSRITNISGSSKYFCMGVTAYSNKAKKELLGVSEKKLKKYGAVSKEIAFEMAKGIKNLSDTDMALAVTGIAGPTGGTKKKPVGLVYIAVVSDSLTNVKKYLFTGNRTEIKYQISTRALDMVRCMLLSGHRPERPLFK